MTGRVYVFRVVIFISIHIALVSASASASASSLAQSRKHAEHLVDQGQRHVAVLHLVAARHYAAALDMLLAMELYDQAYYFRRACVEVRGAPAGICGRVLSYRMA